MKRVKPIIWGLAIIALGVIFGGNAIGLFNVNVFFDGWWSLFIIVPSAISLITDREKLSSLVALACGVILLLAAQDVFSYDIAWKAMVAIFLIAIGLSIIIKGAHVFTNKNDKEVEAKMKSAKGSKNDEDLIAIFSGSDRVYSNKEEFTGASLTAVFGGVELDLRKATVKKDACIKAFCVFGGIDIKVPEDVDVKVKSGFVFGGISDDRKDTTKKGKNTIYIDAAGGFGGISIEDDSTKRKK